MVLDFFKFFVFFKLFFSRVFWAEIFFTIFFDPRRINKKNFESIHKTVGRHFRLPGHEPHRDLVMLPIKIVSARDPFLLRAREAHNIAKFQTEKRMGIFNVEHGLNLDRGQQ